MNDLKVKSEYWADHVADTYANSPIVRSLVRLALDKASFGICSALEEAFIETRNRIREEQATAFFAELEKHPELLSEETAQSQEFVHRFLVTLRAVSLTRQIEKIRYFAGLLMGSLASEAVVSDDSYEEYLSIVSELSWTEMQLLSMLAEKEKLSPAKTDLRKYEDIILYWEAFEESAKKLLQCGSEELKVRLGRLERTGCYWVVRHLQWDKTITVGKLTPIFYTMKKVVSVVEPGRQGCRS